MVRQKCSGIRRSYLVIESLQSNLKDVVFELSQGRNPAELSLLLSNYVNVALEELSSTSIAIER